VFKPGDTLSLTGKNPWIAADTNSSLEQPHAAADNVVEAVSNDQSFADLSHARVRYTSSNPGVATVNSRGQVTALGAGVTTIGVTVDGVTGTAVMDVQQPFSLNAPAVAIPGTAATATTTLTNTGSAALRNVSVTLTAPSGWTVTAATPSSFGQVAAGQAATTTWTVTAPAGAPAGSNELTATATFTGPSGRSTAQQTVPVSVPYPSLTAAFNNPGISDDAHTSAGNLDGGGFSYSAQALAAVGLTPGVSVTHDGQTFTWPSAAPGTADNVVAGGQTVGMSGSGPALGFLGTGDYGTVSGTGTVIYTDGTTQSFDLSFADWWANAAAGGDILASVPYINTPTGKQTQKVSVYYASVPLQPGKTVRYVTLPDVSQAAVQGSAAMHIFAMTAG
jgi:hypothetical protein